jgi:hypothetical protein
MMASILELLRADIRSRDEAEFSLGDTLDVKASILLVVVIFLADVTGGLLASKSPHAHVILIWAQLLCAIFLLISGGLIVYAVWPRAYLMEIETRASNLLRYFEEDPSTETDLSVGEQILREDISKAVDRVRHNHAINVRKSRILSWAFYAALPALALELASTVILLYYSRALLKGHIL